MIKRLFDILSLFKEYFLFGFYLLAAIMLLAFNEGNQIRAIRSVAVVAAGALQEAVGFIPNYFDLRRENRILRELNLTLSDEVSRLREARLENIRLRQLVALKERTPFTYVSANVVGKNLQLLRNSIMIDVGSKDGIQRDMPIVTESGLVGKVSATSSGYAVGQILLNKEMRVSAKVQRSRADGIVQWDGGSALIMRNVVRSLDVKPGDVVITSDYSSLYPPGIVIGVVSQTVQPPGSLFQTVEITPSVDFSRLETVFVVTHVPDTSRTVLERQIHE